jgi:hypothetical protein
MMLSELGNHQLTMAIRTRVQTKPQTMMSIIHGLFPHPRRNLWYQYGNYEKVEIKVNCAVLPLFMSAADHTRTRAAIPLYNPIIV